MAKNFLAVSPSFVAEMENKKAKTDRMAVFAEIFSMLDDSYRTDLSYGAISNILKEKGFNYSLSSVRNLLKLIKATRKFLLDKADMKVTEFVFANNKTNPSAYMRFVSTGISCFIKDEITSWEKVEKILANKNNEGVDKLSFDAVQDEQKEDTTIDDFSKLIKDLGSGISDWSAFFRDRIHLLCVLFDKSCADLSRKKQELEEQIGSIKDLKVLKKEHCECLDELKRFTVLEADYKKLILKISELKKEKRQDKKTIKLFQDNKHDLESEIIRLKLER